ncbi:uncharacterized protein V1510DRAFT_417935 [Dipodascopsis tothii]|uniref:uncharacterized protein n=1 Tax=Dipodascopsis tothii TaxID=44089 RepID=UPI0034CF6230
MFPSTIASSARGLATAADALGLAVSAPAAATAFIDTHCHLDLTLKSARARSKGPGGPADEAELAHALFPPALAAVVDICCDVPVNRRGSRLADAFARGGRWPGKYYFTVGCHPLSAHRHTPEDAAAIEAALVHPAAVAVGECGLDYKKSTHRAVQAEVFRQQIRLALRLGLPFVVHTREADDDTLAILEAEVPVGHPFHVHCFTSSVELGNAILDRWPNAVIGITGVITYASLDTTPALLRGRGLAVLDRIVLETDSPYMVPANVRPRNRRVSHSGMIPFVAARVADLLECPLERVLTATTANARRVYGI